MSTRCGACLSSCGMAVLLADGLQSSTSLHDSGTSSAGGGHLGLYVNNGEAGITLPIEMSFVPPEEVLQIVLAAVLRNQKRCGNRGVPIVLHEFADKLRADGIGIEELPDHFRLIRCHIPSLLLKATAHLVEAHHHFLTFLR